MCSAEIISTVLLLPDNSKGPSTQVPVMAAANGIAVNGSAKAPLFSLGAIADVQYADIPVPTLSLVFRATTATASVSSKGLSVDGTHITS
jgi:hypothetical protein